MAMFLYKKHDYVVSEKKGGGTKSVLWKNAIKSNTFYYICIYGWKKNSIFMFFSPNLITI